MKRLIDGYNLMHAVVLLPGQKLGRDGLKRVRNAFLTRLADRLGPMEASQTTVVFDAAEPPGHLPRQTSHKGLTVLFATETGDADEEIERLIAAHRAPRQLTLVSSDRRLQVAAARRRAQFMSSDDFWDHIQHPTKPERAKPPVEERAAPTSADASYWRDQFREVDAMPELRQLDEQRDALLTDAEIARITFEVEQEYRRHKPR